MYPGEWTATAACINGDDDPYSIKAPREAPYGGVGDTGEERPPVDAEYTSQSDNSALLGRSPMCVLSVRHC